ncbi:hypothetical protein pb186bvf_015250 [Paramecium bursaria]
MAGSYIGRFYNNYFSYKYDGIHQKSQKHFIYYHSFTIKKCYSYSYDYKYINGIQVTSYKFQNLIQHGSKLYKKSPNHKIDQNTIQICDNIYLFYWNFILKNCQTLGEKNAINGIISFIYQKNYKYVLNVKVTPMIQDTEERTQLYFKCLDYVAKLKMTSNLYQELLYLHNDEEKIKTIQFPCNRTCQIFCDELAKFYIRSMKNQSPQTFEYEDTLNTIKEEFSMQSSYYQDNIFIPKIPSLILNAFGDMKNYLFSRQIFLSSSLRSYQLPKVYFHTSQTPPLRMFHSFNREIIVLLFNQQI